jgi:superfamily II helicase
MQDSKTCTHCKQAKALSEFNRNRHRPDGYAHQCKECYRAYYRANRESILSQKALLRSHHEKPARKQAPVKRAARPVSPRPTPAAAAPVERYHLIEAAQARIAARKAAVAHLMAAAERVLNGLDQDWITPQDVAALREALAETKAQLEQKQVMK